MDQQTQSHSTRWRCITLALLLTAFALRLQALSLQNIWWDEARNIDVALRPFFSIPTAPELDIHPPVYFWLLHTWGRLMDLGNSVNVNPAVLNPPAAIAFTTRYLSVFAGTLSVALLYVLTKRSTPRLLNPTVAATAAATIGALSPFWLAESQETRMYTLGFALIAAAAIALISALRFSTIIPATEQPPAPVRARPRLQLVFFALFSALAFLVHYNALFILVAWFGWWLGWSLLQSKTRWQQIRTMLLTGVALTILVLPIAPIALRQIPGYENPNLTVPTIQSYLVQNWQAYFGGYAFTPELLGEGSIGIYWLWLLAAIFIFGLISALIFIARDSANDGTELGLSTSPPHLNPPLLGEETDTGHAEVSNSQIERASRDSPLSKLERARVRLKHSQARSTANHPSPHSPIPYPLFLLFWLLGGLALYYIAVLDRGAFNPRYSSFVTPALYAVCGIALAGLYKLWRPSALIATAIIIAGLIPALYADLYDERFAREDMQSTASWLRENTSTTDLILVDQKYPFGFYYQRYTSDSAQQPIGNNDGDAKADARYLFVDANTIDQTLTNWAGNAERVFYIRWFESDTDPRRVATFLLDHNGTRLGKKQFRGYSVTWWDLNPPNNFQLADDLPQATHVFQPAVEVIAVALPTAPVIADTKIPVVLRWRRIPLGFVDRPLKARVALHPIGDAKILRQDDRPLLNDRHLRTPEWTLDDQPINVYEVPIPADLEAGQYELRLIIYDEETLEARTYFDVAGNPAGIEALLGLVEITN